MLAIRSEAVARASGLGIPKELNGNRRSLPCLCAATSILQYTVLCRLGSANPHH
jgi:hypothetical protein